MSKKILSELKNINDEIEAVKRELIAIGDMRPGNLNRQFRKPKEKLGEYFQLNYTFKGRTKTEHVRKENIPIIESELDAYQSVKRQLKWRLTTIKVACQYRFRIAAKTHVMDARLGPGVQLAPPLSGPGVRDHRFLVNRLRTSPVELPQSGFILS